MSAHSHMSFLCNMDRIPVPQDFCCSITGDVMMDPVCTVDGHTYERAAIRQWFSLGNRSSPKTNAVLPSIELTPNHALRCAIEAYLKERPEIERQQQDIEYACEITEDEVALKLSMKEAEIEALMSEVDGQRDHEEGWSAERFPECFEDMRLSENLLRGVYSIGLERPSKIQRQAVPPMIAGRDIIARAMYGWGNTTAFVVGALQSINITLRQCQAVILVRTNEVARKVYLKCLSLGQNMDVADVMDMGQLVVATLQECRILIDRGDLQLDACRLLVMDEVDLMLRLASDFLKLGGVYGDYKQQHFQISSRQSTEQETYYVMKHFPRFTQLALFLDAGKDRLPAAVRKFRDKMMRRPLELDMQKDSIPAYHFCVDINEGDKLDWFCDFYENNEVSQFVFFCNTARKVRWLRDQLVEEGFSVSMLYGQLDSSQREKTLEDFCCGHTRVLVTTDNIAKRGYDFPHVRVVINFDVADSGEIYQHRARGLHYFSGRGVVISLVTPCEEAGIKKIEDSCQVCMETLPTLPMYVSNLLT